MSLLGATGSTRARARRACWALLGLVVSVTACGGASITSSRSSSTPSDPLPDPPYYVTITASGVSPNVVHVWSGRAVLFRNEDARSHSVNADPHPAHHECNGLLNLGSLKAGEIREVPNMPINACFFHSEEDPGQRAFQGVVVVH